MDDADKSTIMEDSRVVAQCSLNGDDLRAISWDKVRLSTSSDRLMQHLIVQIEEGFPDNRAETAADIRDFHHIKDDLYMMDGVVMFGERIVMPLGLWKEAIDTTQSTSRDNDDVITGQVNNVLARHYRSHQNGQGLL